MKTNFIRTIIILFVIVSLILWGIDTYATGFSMVVLMSGNTLLAGLSIGVYVVMKTKITARPQAFVNGVMAASFLKLIVCMTTLLAYVLINKPNVHKPTIFTLMAVYAVYAAVETWLLSRMARDVK